MNHAYRNEEHSNFMGIQFVFSKIGSCSQETLKARLRCYCALTLMTIVL